MMPTLFIPYCGRLEIPEYMPDGAKVLYGTELEMIGTWESFQLDHPFDPVDKPYYMDAFFERLRSDIGFYLNVNIATSDIDIEQYAGWHVKAESGVACLPHEVATETVSPILQTSEGIDEIGRVYDYYHRRGFFTNNDSGLHTQIQLWTKESLSENDLRAPKNLLWAFQQNLGFFKQLMSPERRRNSFFCEPNPPILRKNFDIAQNLEELLTSYPKKDLMLNPRALKKHGTMEYRFREAEDYPDALGIIQFCIMFGIEAVLNREVRAEDVLKKYGMECYEINWRPKKSCAVERNARMATP